VLTRIGEDEEGWSGDEGECDAWFVIDEGLSELPVTPGIPVFWDSLIEPIVFISSDKLCQVQRSKKTVESEDEGKKRFGLEEPVG